MESGQLNQSAPPVRAQVETSAAATGDQPAASAAATGAGVSSEAVTQQVDELKSSVDPAAGDPAAQAGYQRLLADLQNEAPAEADAAPAAASQTAAPAVTVAASGASGSQAPPTPATPTMSPAAQAQATASVERVAAQPDAPAAVAQGEKEIANVVVAGAQARLQVAAEGQERFAGKVEQAKAAVAAVAPAAVAPAQQQQVAEQFNAVVSKAAAEENAIADARVAQISADTTGWSKAIRGAVNEKVTKELDGAPAQEASAAAKAALDRAADGAATAFEQAVTAQPAATSPQRPSATAPATAPAAAAPAAAPAAAAPAPMQTASEQASAPAPAPAPAAQPQASQPTAQKASDENQFDQIKKVASEQGLNAGESRMLDKLADKLGINRSNVSLEDVLLELLREALKDGNLSADEMALLSKVLERMGGQTSMSKEQVLNLLKEFMGGVGKDGAVTGTEEQMWDKLLNLIDGAGKAEAGRDGSSVYDSAGPLGTGGGGMHVTSNGGGASGGSAMGGASGGGVTPPAVPPRDNRGFASRVWDLFMGQYMQQQSSAVAGAFSGGGGVGGIQMAEDQYKANESSSA